MTNTNKQSILRNFGDFLRKEVAVMELFKDLVLDPGMQQRPIRSATIRPQAARAALAAGASKDNRLANIQPCSADASRGFASSAAAN